MAPQSDAGIASKLTSNCSLEISAHAASPVLAGVPFPSGTLSISIGLACRTRFDESPYGPGFHTDMAESLFHAADQALYVAKTSGRNQIHTVLVSDNMASAK